MDSLVYHTTERVEKTGLIIDTKVYVDLKDGVTIYQYLYRGPEVISTSCVQLPFIEFGRFITSVGAFLWAIRGMDPSLVDLKVPKPSDWTLFSDDTLDTLESPDPKTNDPPDSPNLEDEWDLGDDLDLEL
jgi:hypothetical protein